MGTASKHDEDEYDINDIVVEVNDDQNMIDILKKYKKNKKNYKTSPVLTKYERCRVLSERANQKTKSFEFLTHFVQITYKPKFSLVETIGWHKFVLWQNWHKFVLSLEGM